MRNVRSNSERQAAEEIADAKRCEDFDTFKPLFAQVQADLDAGIRTTRPFVRDLGMSKADIQPGEFFILGGQTAYIAEVGEPIKAPNGQTDARLRVIYSNGTESDLLLRSFQRALYKDEGGRRISEPTAGPLFEESEPEPEPEPDRLATGTLYVLRSRSTHPTIAAHRDLIHKIGITGGSVEARIAGAVNDATYLLPTSMWPRPTSSSTCAAPGWRRSFTACSMPCAATSRYPTASAGLYDRANGFWCPAYHRRGGRTYRRRDTLGSDL